MVDGAGDSTQVGYKESQESPGKPIHFGRVDQELDHAGLDPFLGEILDAWPRLPEQTRQVLLDVIRAHLR